MSISPASVYRSLTPDSKRILLAQCLPALRTGDIPQELAELALSASQQRDLEELLNKVSVLGSDAVAFIVRSRLVDLGWTEKDFRQSHSDRDRACSLLLTSKDAFEDVIAIYNGNRLWWRERQEHGFHLPKDAGPLDEVDWPDGLIEEDTCLYSLIKGVLDEVESGKQLVRITLNRRTSLGLQTDSPEVIQCDISFGEDPVEVEINADGCEEKLTLSFLSRIVVLIDPNAGTLFVGSEKQSKKLRTGLAMAFIQGMFAEGGEPVSLPAIGVFPEKLRTRLVFPTEQRDKLDGVRVSGLWYRLLDAPSEIQRSIRSSSGDASIHDQPDIIADSGNLRIYRAQIEFLFKAASRKREPVKRTVTLNNPISIAYGKAFPQQRLIINRVLGHAGLIDDLPDPGISAGLQDLYRFRTPQHEAEVRSSWPEDLRLAIVKAGILVPGPAADSAWCDDCGHTHEIAIDEKSDAHVQLVRCPHEQRPVSEAAVRTLMLDSEGAVSWIAGQLETDQQKATHVCDRCWFLGSRQFQTNRGEHGVFLTLDWQRSETILSIIRFLESRRSLTRGAVITLGPAANPGNLGKDWITLPLDAVAKLQDRGLIVDTEALEAAILGRPMKQKHATPQKWKRFFDTYEKTKTGLGHYSEADRMLEIYPELCPGKREHVARALKKHFPGHFSK